MLLFYSVYNSLSHTMHSNKMRGIFFWRSVFAQLHCVVVFMHASVLYEYTTHESDVTDKMKRSFFQAAVASILLYGCTTWTLTKRLEKKLDGNYTRMLRAILNKSWRQHTTRHQLYGHLPPITKTIQVRRTRDAGHCWRSRDELIRDVLSWTPAHGRAKAGRPARTYIQQLCEDTGCCPEDLPRAMNDREEWRERVRDIRATSAIWWWLYIYMCVCVCVCVWLFITYIYIRVCVWIFINIYIYIYIYLPTPPLGLDMTQRQFLSGV